MTRTHREGNIMLYSYYVNDNTQTNGDHEVHREDCWYLPLIVSKTYLGLYSGCSGAVQKAQTIYTQANGCAFCSPLCHTS